MTAILTARTGSRLVPSSLPDDRRFLAASQLAVTLIDLCGDVPEVPKAKRVSVLTFLLLELLDAQTPASG